MAYKLLILNFGSTSSKVAVFEDEESVFAKTIRYDAELLAANKAPAAQLGFRRESIFDALKEAGTELSSLDAICCRAGLLKAVESGIYHVDDNVISDANDPDISGRGMQGIALTIAKEISAEYQIPAYMCDPVSTDELIDVARVTGIKGIERTSGFHALNHKKIARLTAKAIGKPYEELNLIGIHLGGGSSVAAHCKGRCIDMFACADEGSFCMDRPGTLPNRALIDFCFSGKTRDEVMFTIMRESGVYSLLGTSDFREVEERMVAGDAEASLVFRAMAYQVAKCVGEMAAAMSFEVDGIFVTGGIAFSKRMVDEIRGYIGKLAPIYEFPGEDEMQALAENALAALRGEREVKTY